MPDRAYYFHCQKMHCTMPVSTYVARQQKGTFLECRKYSQGINVKNPQKNQNNVFAVQVPPYLRSEKQLRAA